MTGAGSNLIPSQVAVIYRTELQKRAEHFDVIAFGIFQAGYGPDNFLPFAKAFEDWTPTATRASKRRAYWNSHRAAGSRAELAGE